MKLSVCMATYNGARFIREQLQTILNQTRQPDEVIICDDCSTDETASIVADFIARNQLEKKNWRFYQNQENKGYPGNFYYAMGLCQGEIVFLADQDDLWHEKKLEIMGKLLEESEKSNLVACKYEIVDSEGRQIHTVMNPTHNHGTGQLREITVDDVLRKYEWPGMVLAYKKSWFDHNLIVEGEDSFPSVPHDLILCLLGAERKSFYQINQVLSYHRRHENNAAKEEHRIHKLLNKERKIQEVEEYIIMLLNLLTSKALKEQETYRLLKKKLEAMQARMKALKKGKLAVLTTAWKYRRLTRAFTLICDFIIA